MKSLCVTQANSRTPPARQHVKADANYQKSTKKNTLYTSVESATCIIQLLKMENLRKKEKIYSALYFLSSVFATYRHELNDLLPNAEENCPELVRLQKAIDGVVRASSINTMTDRQKMAILDDHEKLKLLIDKFMKL